MVQVIKEKLSSWHVTSKISEEANALTSSLQRGEVLAQPFTSYLACARYYITSEIQLQVRKTVPMRKTGFGSLENTSTSQHDALHKLSEQ